MVELLDSNGELWEVERVWFDAGWSDFSDMLNGGDFLSAVFVAISVPLLLTWPFWFAAKFLGYPWAIVVRHADTEVRREQVRGWRASKLRVAEIAAQLQQEDTGTAGK